MLVALDHFAGTGWGVACHWLGIREYGAEIMKEAIFTRRAAGFRTIYRDVWSGLLHPWLVPFHTLYIASPPCQTFSVAGRGTGRKALEQVLSLIDTGVWKDPEKLRAAGAELGDDRTALVLTPLAHIWAHRPQLIALEQVPTVLPVWEAVADVLRGLGYSVWTGNLQAEQYGVAQTRRRAILMARIDGPVKPPAPTHSRYYSREPHRLDPGVLPWVSMAEALGWNREDRIGFPRLADRAGGAVMIGDVAYRARDFRGADQPSFVVTEKARSWSRFGSDGAMKRISVHEASVLQSYPAWVFESPSPTIAADPRVAPRGCKHPREGCCSAWPGKPGRQFPEGTVRLDESQAATLQSFPSQFPFQGSRGKQFLQVGNAVPPLLAYAILSELIGDSVPAQAATIVEAIDDEWAEFALLEPLYA